MATLTDRKHKIMRELVKARMDVNTYKNLLRDAEKHVEEYYERLAALEAECEDAQAESLRRIAETEDETSQSDEIGSATL